jgi:hypothetical protein
MTSLSIVDIARSIFLPFGAAAGAAPATVILYIDPRLCVLVSSATDDYGIDPRLAQLAH